MSNRLFLLVFVLVALAGSALGQNYYDYRSPVGAAPLWNTVQMPDHSMPAVHRDLTPSYGVTEAHGERAAEDFEWPAERPLGDVARDNRKEHAKAKKATVIWRP